MSTIVQDFTPEERIQFAKLLREAADGMESDDDAAVVKAMEAMDALATYVIARSEGMLT